LASLGACQEIIYSAFAAIHGIKLDSVKVEVKGNINLQGLFGLDKNASAGFTDISYETTIQSSASESEIKNLIELVENHCPVLDTLQRPIPITGKVNIIQSVEELA